MQPCGVQLRLARVLLSPQRVSHVQDAVVLARMLREELRPSDLSNADRPQTLRSLLTPDLVQVLRQYEKERKARTRLITIRSNLMGQALQIPFAPVSQITHDALLVQSHA